MLTRLRLSNFRGFDIHELPLKPHTIIVGRNNAGKSTIVEALRLVALVTSRFSYLNFRPPPDWLDIPMRMRGMTPDLSRAEFDFRTAFHDYADPPAVITADFDNRTQVRVYIGEENAVHAVVLADGRPISDKASARRVHLPRVAILPQVGPLVHEEEQLTPDYVRRTMDTALASTHFRNQLYLDPLAVAEFTSLVSQTWHGVRVWELERLAPQFGVEGPEGKPRLSLLVQNDSFVAEASRMGHGLQMWLQVMWFLARTPPQSSVILDEPDVYMHPDLQRRLLRLVMRRHAQAIIATHSSEIMAEVDPENILVIEREQTFSGFASTLPAVQNVIEALGSVHNLHLARLWSAKRFILVEGDDLDLLGPLHAILFPDTSVPLQSIPNGDVGGWSGWERAVGAAAAMRNAVGEPIAVYCLFDSDYHTESAVNQRFVRGKQEHMNLHIWHRKEIENYLLNPSVIQRVIAIRAKPSVVAPTVSQVEDSIDEIVASLREETIAAFATAIQQDDRKIVAGTAYLEAKKHVDAAWQDNELRCGIVSGKRALSALSQWSKSNFDVSFGATTIARSFQAHEIPREVAIVLEAIEGSEPIDDAVRHAA
jgi:energy-coupling factor transporter ATP-binding protein EcfA2